MTYDLGFCSGQPSSELFEYCPVQKSYVGIQRTCRSVILTYPQIFFTRTSPMKASGTNLQKIIKFLQPPACEAEEIEVILNMIEHGFGISVLPYLDIFKNRNVDVLPLSETKWESTFLCNPQTRWGQKPWRKDNLDQIIHNSKWTGWNFRKARKMAVGILTQFKKGQVEVKLGTGFFLKQCH